MKAPDTHQFRFGDFELDVRAGELRKHGLKIRLRDQSLQILLMLLKRPGEIVLREEIRLRLWPNNTVVEFDHSINAAIKRLRNALSESAEEPRFIETLARKGYRFTGEVEHDVEHDVEREDAEEELPGARTTNYRIFEKLGSGGMGIVYRAEDLKLGRQVALKFLPEEFVSDPIARERFEREARAASALNHPGICAIYGFEEIDGQPVIAMELVEGETLQARLARGPIPRAQALTLAIQICDALGEAHRKGVVHRDLKPANIMLTDKSAWSVKILDFGIARMASDAPGLTRTGVVAGTLRYMSPEQAEELPADSRSDIFSFGVVFREMLTGKPSPHGALSGPIDQVVQRCLEPDPEERWQLARDLKVQLEWIAERKPSNSAALPPNRSWMLMAMFALCVALAGAIAWKLLRNPSAAPVADLNVSLLPPPDTSFRFARNGEGGFALSPDGTMLAFVGRTEGKAQLWMRSLRESEARLLPGSEGAYEPFWSPDSRWIAFFTPQKLKKVEIGNGAVIDLCDVPAIPNSGTWSPRGVILWGNAVGMLPIQSIPDAGGLLTPVPGTAGGYMPSFLPDGRRFIYTPGGPGLSTRHDLWLASLDPDEKPRRIGEAGTQPVYSAGHILSVVNGILTPRPFDPERGEFSGKSFPLKAPLAHRVSLGHLLTDFSANTQGMLVYPPQTSALMELRWRDRTGKELGLLGAPGEYYTPRISPDGRQVAFTRRDGDNSDIWVANPAANSFMRLTFDPGVDENPVWSPDGASVTFGNDGAGRANLYRKAASGAGTIDRLTTENKIEQQPLDWSRDGRFLIYTQISLSAEIMVLAAGGGQPLSFLGHNRGAGRGQFNPGVPRWVAYDFDDSGRREIYVQAFEAGKPASSARWQISDSGGTMARWRGDGKEIFYLSLDGKMMAVRVSSDGPAFHASKPQFLFKATAPEMRTPNFEYDVSADGERFLMIEPMAMPGYQPLTLVSNWQSK